MKIRYKILIYYIVTFAFVLLTIASILTRFELSGIRKAKEDKLNTIGLALIYPARLFFMTGDTTYMFKTVNDLLKDRDIEYLGIYSKDNNYKFIRRKESVGISDSLLDIFRMQNKGIILKSRRVFYISLPVYISRYLPTESFLIQKSEKKEKMGFIILGISDRRLRIAYLPMLISIIFIFTVAFFIGFFVILFLYKQILSRIVIIERGIAKIKDGNLDTRIKISGEDELALFSNTLNDMVDAVQKRMEEIEKLNRGLQEKTQALREANKRILEEKELREDFFTNLTHELKTPLQVIKGFIELSLREKLNNDVRKRMGTIKRHTEKLINIVDNLLMLKTKKFEEFKDINLKEVIEEVVHKEEENAHKKGLIFNIGVQDNIHILGDRNGLKTVYTHIINNAIKFSQKGTISITGKTEGENSVLMISDHGIGIKKEEIKKVKIPFYQVERGDAKKYKGLGIGLSIAELIIKAHKGEMKIYSEENKGTTVVIKIPLTHGDGA